MNGKQTKRHIQFSTYDVEMSISYRVHTEISSKDQQTEKDMTNEIVWDSIIGGLVISAVICVFIIKKMKSKSRSLSIYY